MTHRCALREGANVRVLLQGINQRQNGNAEQCMGIADRIYELVKELPDRETSKILQFAESLRNRSVTVVLAQRHVDLAAFRQFR